MYRGWILLHLVLWITAVHAFFPYRPEYLEVDVGVSNKRTDQDGESVSAATKGKGFIAFQLSSPPQTDDDEPLTRRISRIARGLAMKYGSELPSGTVPEDLIHSKRNNKYSIVEAEQPTQSNSAGINQDGTDYSYFVQASLGSSDTQVYMLIDTGASTTWVMGSACTTDICNMHNTFGPGDSDTLTDAGKPLLVAYGSGNVSGRKVSDSVKIGGLKVTMSFGLANDTSSQFSQFPFDGILGLTTSTSEQTFMQELVKTKAIDSNIFAVSLSRSADGGSNTGEISFGATNPAKYTGDISYTPLDASSGGRWAISVDDITVGGKSSGVTGKRAFIDTGTTYAFGPSADVKALYKMVPGSSSDDGGVTWKMPCNSDAPVAFVFSGKSYSVSSKDFLSSPNSDGMCTGNIFGIDIVQGAWLLGDVFLKNVYSVFDADKSRIGFAAKAAVPTSTKTSFPTGISTVTTATGTSTLTTMAAAPTAVGPDTGLNGHETATSPSAATNTGGADSSSTIPTSLGAQLNIGHAYVPIVCILSILTVVV